MIMGEKYKDRFRKNYEGREEEINKIGIMGKFFRRDKIWFKFWSIGGICIEKGVGEWRFSRGICKNRGLVAWNIKVYLSNFKELL